MLIVDENGWLKTDSTGDPEIRIVPTRRCYHLLEPPCDGDSEIIEHPLAWCWHTTDTWRSMEFHARRIADATVKGTSSWTTGTARDGVIWQSAPLTVGTWGIGNPGVVAGRACNNVNHVLGQTELESLGRCERGSDGHFYAHPYWKVDPATKKPSRSMGLDPACRVPERDSYGQIYEFVQQPRSGPYSAGWWPVFTQAQIAGAEAMVRAVRAWRPIGYPNNAPPPLADAALWKYGHVDFPGRTGKEDPGPLWPAIRDGILERTAA